MRYTRSALVAIPLVLFLSAAVLAREPRVTLDSGIYEGVPTGIPGSSAVVHKYLGVPYAASPTRFAPAQPPPPSTDTKKANVPPPACTQNGGKAPEKEDCLYLNVFAPEPGRGTASKTVMVWLYGGGLQSGSASLRMYDGTSFAANQDVIIVAPNYRTNAFGFPGESPVIPRESRNLGLLDQRVAFEWVRKHISKFGGDPAKVTVFGQSAGARSADFHLLTMKNPPFRAVIMQSGSSELTPLADSSRTRGDGTGFAPFGQLAAAVGCSSPKNLLDCMRKVPVEKIKETIASNRLYFGSIEDGGFTTVKDQAVVRRAHQAANVSLLMGTNADEQRGMIGDQKDWKLDRYLASKFASPDIKAQVSGLYAVGPNTTYKTDFESIAAIETDIAYTCITSREARISAESGYPTWRYFFKSSVPQPGIPKSGSRHATEIPFVFGTLSLTASSEDIALSKQMQKVWANFAKDPTKGPGWSTVGSGDNDIGSFGLFGKFSVISNKDLDRNCRLFEHLYVGRA